MGRQSQNSHITAGPRGLTSIIVIRQLSQTNKVCSALDPDKGTELELTVYTLTVHDGGVNQGLCAESKMYIDDLRVKGGVILGRGWEVHVFFVSAQHCGCAVAPPGAAFCPGCMLFL